MISIGDVARGSIWPETVEIKKVEVLGDNLYLVESLGRTSNKYYETMLQGFEIDSIEKLNINDNSNKNLEGKTFQRFLEYFQFKVDEKYSSARALGNKKVIPLPHQIEAVYGTMLQVPDVKFLLADDPGAGKTIMTGMLIRELRARKSADRILILVPPLVLIQWQEELKSKFNEDFKIVTRATLNEASGKNPFEEYPLCLASIYWAARNDVKDYLLEANYDMVVVDEAHKMAAYTHGTKVKKTKKTRIYQLGEAILKNTEHKLLLTATPHKGDIENYRHLLKLIDDDIFANVSSGESIKEKSNPFVIRRLKEQMVNFDGTPIFPERSTITIEFDLSVQEKLLYKQVTDYVTEHFNRAEQRGNKGTSFAMMLLQRRLSSSIDAIYYSLVRRLEGLEKLLIETTEEQNKISDRLEEFDYEEYEDESSEIQEEMEELLEKTVDAIDVEELKKEIEIVKEIVSNAKRIRDENTDRKYDELENTLFGEEGLIKKGEKILIFTEAVDTLNFLENKLKDRIPIIAKIVGKYSMDERRKQVELFRNEAPLMLATDAGGESINLQFCNQMINYDIPWNPNKLEQRMGRIHRIGQKNNVVVFNLVAKNTREGDVMCTLLKKMEKMKDDLGKDLVFDFIGDILEDNNISLATLMEEAVRNRTNLDELILKMEKVLSEEHIKLIEMAKQERLDENSFDLPGMRSNQNQLILNIVPTRAYAMFTNDALENRNVKINQNAGSYRVERLPKSLRDFARKKLNIVMKESMLKYSEKDLDDENSTIPQMQNDHPLFKLSMELTETELEKVALEKLEIKYPTRERLNLEIYEISIGDGTGREIAKELLYVASNEGGETIEIDPYFIQGINSESKVSLQNSDERPKLLYYAIKYTQNKLNYEKKNRSSKIDKKSEFLKRTFEAQYKDTMEKLSKYRATNEGNKNSALINQMNAKLIEIEEKQEFRLEEINRERTIQMRPPKCLLSIFMEPDSSINKRPMIKDYKNVIKEYEISNCRGNLSIQKQFGLVDLYSEESNGAARYVILIDDLAFKLNEYHKQDLRAIEDKLYIYYINEDKEIVEVDKRLYL